MAAALGNLLAVTVAAKTVVIPTLHFMHPFIQEDLVMAPMAMAWAIVTVSAVVAAAGKAVFHAVISWMLITKRQVLPAVVRDM